MRSLVEPQCFRRSHLFGAGVASCSPFAGWKSSGSQSSEIGWRLLSGACRAWAHSEVGLLKVARWSLMFWVRAWSDGGLLTGRAQAQRLALFVCRSIRAESLSKGGCHSLASVAWFRRGALGPSKHLCVVFEFVTGNCRLSTCRDTPIKFECNPSAVNAIREAEWYVAWCM